MLGDARAELGISREKFSGGKVREVRRRRVGWDSEMRFAVVCAEEGVGSVTAEILKFVQN